VDGERPEEQHEMPSEQKVQKVKELAERFKASQGAMFADYRGLTVKDATELRRALKQAETAFAVAKNTLTKLAVKEAGLEDAVDLLEGPTAIAFIKGDALTGAKAILDAAKRFPALVVKGAVVEGRVLREDDAKALATLEAKDVSVAKVAGMLQAPIARIIYLLQAPLQRMAYALAERGRQGVEAEPAATAEPAAAEGSTESEAAAEPAAAEEAAEPSEAAEATEPEAEPEDPEPAEPAGE
jgi:large subunit ribosomal protein L10